MQDKVQRNIALARSISFWIQGSHIVDIEIACRLAKSDLQTEMVGEFPELQGIMGYYYALEEGLGNNVATAIRDHYLPLGLKDSVPTNESAIVVSLADKLDSLVSLILVGEMPTGSKDPFALRRNAIGIIRIIIENKINIPLKIMVQKALNCHIKFAKIAKLNDDCEDSVKKFKNEIERKILNFFEDRLQSYLKNRGVEQRVIEALWEEKQDIDLFNIERKSVALQGFIETNQGKDFLEAYKRMYKTYTKAEEEDGGTINKKLSSLGLKEPKEKELYKIYKQYKGELGNALKAQEYDVYLDMLCNFTEVINDFFEAIMVNCDNKVLRQNRLKLLATICKTVNNFAKFERIC